MRKLKLQVQLSIDGFIAGPNGEMDWLTWDWDEELKQYVGDLTEPVDCILLGQNLGPGFIQAWSERASDPEAADPSAHKFNDTPKIIFSRTLEPGDWKNAVIERGDVTEAVRRLKQQEGGDLIAYGGARFVSSLIAAGLIDDLHLFVNPTALGQGMPIFIGRTPLRLAEAKAFSCGIVVHHYQPVGNEE
ncbi:dihydrofolate reductase family protein [Larkinella soli]|uniref:dihydrofolate reductase family protein n=1 Tax=Larkinella soli TaxID=1770527 RepID=UPI000FFB6C1C|nr:dihydrofolate reductase family protein [Larkinella soli]